LKQLIPVWNYQIPGISAKVTGPFKSLFLDPNSGISGIMEYTDSVYQVVHKITWFEMCALIDDQFPLLVTEQSIGNLTNAISGWRKGHLVFLNPAVLAFMAPFQGSYFLEDTMSDLSPSQWEKIPPLTVSTIGPPLISGIPLNSFAVFSSEQLSSMNCFQLQALTAAQKAVLISDKLTLVESAIQRCTKPNSPAPGSVQPPLSPDADAPMYIGVGIGGIVVLIVLIVIGVVLFFKNRAPREYLPIATTD